MFQQNLLVRRMLLLFLFVFRIYAINISTNEITTSNVETYSTYIDSPYNSHIKIIFLIHISIYG